MNFDFGDIVWVKKTKWSAPLNVGMVLYRYRDGSYLVEAYHSRNPIKFHDYKPMYYERHPEDLLRHAWPSIEYRLPTHFIESY